MMKQLILILLLSTISFAQSSMLLLYGEEGYKNAETKIYLRLKNILFLIYQRGENGLNI